MLLFQEGQLSDGELCSDLYKRYGSALKEYAKRRGLDEDRRENVATDTTRDFVDQVAPGFENRGPGSVRRCLYGIAKRRCQNEIRKRKKLKQREHFLGEGQELPNGARDDGPSVIAERKDLLERLTECLGRLPKKKREVIVRRVYVGQTFVAIGKEMGITLSKAYRLYREGLDALRQCLSRNGRSA